MIPEAKNWWEQHGRSFQEKCPIPIDILYGIGSPNEQELGLIGPVAGQRILEIGCGGAQTSIAFAKMGALVTGVDVAASEIEFAKELIQKHMVKVDLLQRDMSDLTPITSESQDVVFSSSAFGYVDDLSVCFKEVFRVLKPAGLFVWGVGHPFLGIIDTETMRVKRSYFETGVRVEGAETGCAFACVDRTVSEYLNTLLESGFQIERLVEPDSRKRYTCDPWFGQWGLTADVLAKMPATMIVKARKPLSDKRKG